MPLDPVQFHEPCPGCAALIAPWEACCSACSTRLPGPLRERLHIAIRSHHRPTIKAANTAIAHWLKTHPAHP